SQILKILPRLTWHANKRYNLPFRIIFRPLLLLPLKGNYRAQLNAIAALFDSTPVKKIRFIQCYNIAREEGLTVTNPPDCLFCTLIKQISWHTSLNPPYQIEDFSSLLASRTWRNCPD